MPAVAADGESGAHLERAVGRIGAHAGDAAAVLDLVDGLRTHPQMERRISLAVIGEEIEEVPLRHQCDELAAGRQVAEIGEDVFTRAEEGADRDRLLVRQPQELLEQAELGHQLERRGMNGVAAEIAQEIGVLPEHDDVDAGTRQEEPEHEPAGPASDDAAAGGESLGRH